MEFGTARTASRHGIGSPDTDDSIVEQRLARLLELNKETLRDRTIYSSERERIEASLMTRPIDSKKTFAYFGLIIGCFPPFRRFSKSLGRQCPSNKVRYSSCSF